MSSYFVLKIQYVNRPPETRNISAATTSIGRESGDIVLNDPQTSGRHAEILFQTGQVRVRDVGSTNGTWFNGQRLMEFVLEPGQWFQAGQTTLQLMAVHGEQPVAPAKTMMAMGAPPPGAGPAGAPPQGWGPPPGARPAGGPPPGPPPGPPGYPPPAAAPAPYGSPAAGPPPGPPGGAPPWGPPPGPPMGGPPPGPPMGGPPMGGPPMGGPPMGGPPMAGRPPGPPMGGPPMGGPPMGGPPMGGPPMGGPPMGGPPMGGPPMGPPQGGPPFGGPPQGGPQPPYGPPQGGPPQGGPQPPYGPPQGGPQPPYGPPQGGPQPPYGPPQGGPQPPYGPAGGPPPGPPMGGPPMGPPMGGPPMGPPMGGPPMGPPMGGPPMGGPPMGPPMGGPPMGGPPMGGPPMARPGGPPMGAPMGGPPMGPGPGGFGGPPMPMGGPFTPAPMGAAGGSGVRANFQGTGGELFVTYLVGALLTSITFGIYASWFFCKIANFVLSNTTLGPTRRGELRLEFTGRGGELFVTFLVGYLLTVITAFIYMPWFMCKLIKFFTNNTTATAQDGTRYRLNFEGTGGELFVTFLVGGLLSAITFYIYLPWFICKLRKVLYQRTAILENEQPVGNLDFEGKGGELFVIGLVGFLLMGITLTIYRFWFEVKLQKFYAENTRINYQGRMFAGAFNGTGGEYFVTVLVGGLLTGITFGIYMPWFMIKLWKFDLNNLEFNELGGAPGGMQAFPPQQQMMMPAMR